MSDGLCRWRLWTLSRSRSVHRGWPVTGYTVLVSGERDRVVAATANKVVVRGVAPGRHSVRVVASNAVGASTASPARKVVVR